MNYNIENTANMPKAAMYACEVLKNVNYGHPEITTVFGIKMFGGNVYVFKEINTGYLECVFEQSGEFGTIEIYDFMDELRKDPVASTAYAKELYNLD